MTFQRVAIIGAGGFAREVLDIFDAVNERKPTFDVLGYIVDAQYGLPGTQINGKPILGDIEWLAEHRHELQAICGVGAPELRRRLVNEAKQHDVTFCSIVHPEAILTRWVTVGEGCVITAGCTLSNQIHVGNHTHINPACTIGHDTIFEEFVTISPGATVSGNVRLETGCYVGTGANIVEKVTIGAWSIVGAGSTIISDVPPNTTVVGLPGKVIKTRPEGWHEK